MSSEVTRILHMSLPETLSPRRSTNGKSTQKDLEHTLERRYQAAQHTLDCNAPYNDPLVGRA